MESALKKAEVLLEALPYIRKYYGKTTVIKYGGNAMENDHLKDTFAQDIALMRFVGINPVVVHGGGPQITDYMERLSMRVEFVDGHRVTDAETMEVAKMVLVGKVNKEIVSRINTQGVEAVGLSGDDAGLISAQKRDHVTTEGHVDLGYVGDVDSINPEILKNLIKSGYIPVVASVGVDERGQSYNINADRVAAAVSTALKADKLIFLTNTKGIYLDFKKKEKQLVEEIDVNEAHRLMQEGDLSEGMLPKLMSCIDAVESGVGRAHIIDGRIEHAVLLEIFTDSGIGTMVVP